jgi:hypothetical protein
VRVQGEAGRQSVTVNCEMILCRLIDKNFYRFPSVIITAASYWCVSDASGPINRPQSPRSVKAWFCRRLLAGVADRIPLGAWMSVSCEWYMLTGRGICEGGLSPIQRSPTERVASECDLET